MDKKSSLVADSKCKLVAIDNRILSCTWFSLYIIGVRNIMLLKKLLLCLVIANIKRCLFGFVEGLICFRKWNENRNVKGIL